MQAGNTLPRQMSMPPQKLRKSLFQRCCACPGEPRLQQDVPVLVLGPVPRQSESHESPPLPYPSTQRCFPPAPRPGCLSVCRADRMRASCCRRRGGSACHQMNRAPASCSRRGKDHNKLEQMLTCAGTDPCKLEQNPTCYGTDHDMLDLVLTCQGTEPNTLMC